MTIEKIKDTKEMLRPSIIQLYKAESMVFIEKLDSSFNALLNSHSLLL